VTVAAKVTETKRVLDLTNDFDFMKMVRDAESEARLNPHRYLEMGEDVLVWKMPSFDLGPEQVKILMKKARKCRALVVDLRGNPGGSVDALLDLIGRLFDRDVKVADLKGRRAGKPLVAQGSGKDAFAGKVVALVDAPSSSAAELFARVLQLEKRGVVLRDRTAGAVMLAVSKGYSLGVDRLIFYGATITEADLVMSDGLSLEGRGVTPDELLLPSAEDLAAERDPVLARALELAGLKRTGKQAGAMFPLQWRP